MSAALFAEQLNKQQGDVTIRINSPGGVVTEGSAIASLMEEYEGEMNAIVDGACYSAAVSVLLAAKERRISKMGELMVHRPWTLVVGYSDEMRDTANNLEEIEETMLNFYTEKTGQDIERLRELMRAETFIQPKEAIELGFINNTSEVKSQDADEETVMAKKFNDMSLFDNLIDGKAPKTKNKESKQDVVETDTVKAMDELDKQEIDALRERAANLQRTQRVKELQQTL